MEAVCHILTDDVWDGKAAGDLGRKHLLCEDLVEKCICLHDNAENGAIVFGGRHNDSWVKLVLRGGGLTAEQITHMHNHFGDETGWLFAWSSYYLEWLRYPAAAGLVLQLVMAAGHGTQWWLRAREVILPLWSVGTLVWLSMMLRFWERKESVLRQRWGLEGRGFGSQRLPGFADHKFVKAHYNEQVCVCVCVCVCSRVCSRVCVRACQLRQGALQ